jgi:DNA replication protein DnaC
MSMTQIKSLMLELKLHGFAAALERTAEEAKKHEWSSEEWLDALLQAEADFRERRKTARRIKQSKLKTQASFEDFDFTAKRSITKAEIREIYSLKWLEEGRPLVLVGQTGVGKTYIAQAAGLHACQNGKTALFLSMNHFLEQQAEARHTGSYLKFRDRMIRPDLLALDDFGMKKLTAVEAEDLREILEERSYGKSTLITTQLPVDHWPEVIPDPVLAEAIRDRMEGPALQIKITGESYRRLAMSKKASKAKQGTAA